MFNHTVWHVPLPVVPSQSPQLPPPSPYLINTNLYPSPEIPDMTSLSAAENHRELSAFTNKNNTTSTPFPTWNGHTTMLLNRDTYENTVRNGNSIHFSTNTDTNSISLPGRTSTISIVPELVISSDDKLTHSGNVSLVPELVILSDDEELLIVPSPCKTTVTQVSEGLSSETREIAADNEVCHRREQPALGLKLTSIVSLADQYSAPTAFETVNWNQELNKSQHHPLLHDSTLIKNESVKSLLNNPDKKAMNPPNKVEIRNRVECVSNSFNCETSSPEKTETNSSVKTISASSQKELNIHVADFCRSVTEYLREKSEERTSVTSSEIYSSYVAPSQQNMSPNTADIKEKLLSDQGQGLLHNDSSNQQNSLHPPPDNHNPSAFSFFTPTPIVFSSPSSACDSTSSPNHPSTVSLESCSPPVEIPDTHIAKSPSFVATMSEGLIELLGCTRHKTYPMSPNDKKDTDDFEPITVLSKPQILAYKQLYDSENCNSKRKELEGLNECPLCNKTISISMEEVETRKLQTNLIEHHFRKHGLVGKKCTRCRKHYILSTCNVPCMCHSCWVCKKRFPPRYIENHLKRVHIKEPIETLAKSSKSGDELYQCLLAESCSYKCPNQILFAKHLADIHHDVIHKDPLIVKCPLCSYKTASINKLRNHIRTFHLGEHTGSTKNNGSGKDRKYKRVTSSIFKFENIKSPAGTDEEIVVD